ncbi:MAG: AAA family ATPase [Fimbriimonas sp.]
MLEEFTAFQRAEFSFVPGVNAIIGENGTGKTHILKALYAAQLTWLKNGGQERLGSVFQLEDSLAGLVRSGGIKSKSARVSGVFGQESWDFAIQRVGSNPNGEGDGDGTGTGWGFGSGSGAGNRFGTGDESGDHPNGALFSHSPQPAMKTLTPLFIPAVDMMGHTKGFVSTFDNFKIDFDLTHREIVSLLLSPEKRELDDASTKLVQVLAECLGGNVELSGERFYLVAKGSRYPMPSVAEGLRKIATLIRLVQTGWLVPGSTLFWDEPEVNLNPILMDEVVGAILTLSRSGVQVFLATHSYIILRELEVQSRKTDSLRFFSLKASESGSEVHQSSRYLDISPNKIEQQYGDLYDRSIAKLSGVSGESRVD